MPYKSQSTKRREVIFNARDEVAFGRILRERYPTIRFIRDTNYLTDDIQTYTRIQDCPGDRMKVFMPKENWQPLILYRGSLPSVRYYLHLPRQHFRYQRGCWVWPMLKRKWAFDPPYLESGQVDGAFWKEDDEEKRLFLVAVWRLITKISKCIGSSWCGYDAMREALERPRGLLDGCFRPPDEWGSFTEGSPYYNDELWDDNAADHPGLDARGDPWLWEDEEDRDTPAPYYVLMEE